jgi:hypothetical protein
MIDTALWGKWTIRIFVIVFFPGCSSAFDTKIKQTAIDESFSDWVQRFWRDQNQSGQSDVFDTILISANSSSLEYLVHPARFLSFQKTYSGRFTARTNHFLSHTNQQIPRVDMIRFNLIHHIMGIIMCILLHLKRCGYSGRIVSTNARRTVVAYLASGQQPLKRVKKRIYFPLVFFRDKDAANASVWHTKRVW